MNFTFPTYQNIKNYFYCNFNIAYDCKEELDSLFVKFEGDLNQNFQDIYKLKPIYYSWRGYDFPVFLHHSSQNLYQTENKLSFDIYLNTFLFLSGFLEKINPKRDQHGRFPYGASLQKKFNFKNIPIVNIYFELLFELALKNQINIKKRSFSKAILFSHDIDQFRSGWLENIQHEFKNFSINSFYSISKNMMIKFFRMEDDYMKAMKKMLQIDKDNHVDGLSFLLVKKSHQNADFDLSNKKYNHILNQTAQCQQIGLHPSYQTFDNKNLFNKEVEFLSKFMNIPIDKSRQHFLRFDMDHTPFIIEQSKIKEDYTLGFAETFGFRNGIANPFHLYNFDSQKAFKYLSIPLVFMDVSLVHYKNIKSLEESFDEIEKLLIDVKTIFNCHFSILFHNSVFSNTKFKTFTAFYKKLIALNHP